ncbi:hypothetical protein ACFV2X_28160 [Streptomyces sp. NPDC059679]|uniref:hypothetical protein n=1 Tax=Streptomyces sp. NPDC059679 TaxID=3346903 RepID=UPI0036CA95E5
MRFLARARAFGDAVRADGDHLPGQAGLGRALHSDDNQNAAQTTRFYSLQVRLPVTQAAVTG